jgi:hypothetical protein
VVIRQSSENLARIVIEPKIAEVWAIAYDIHVWSFHEAKYTIDKIKTL